MIIANSHCTKSNLRGRLNNGKLFRETAYFAGRWQVGSAVGNVKVVNPSTQMVIGTVPGLQSEDTFSAIAFANSVFPVWSGLSPIQRAGYLRKWASLINQHREDLAVILTSEQGKPLSESLLEICYAANLLNDFAEQAISVYEDAAPPSLVSPPVLVAKIPVGVAAAITPWSFPCSIIIRKAGAALAAGCPFIVRPACETPFSALALAYLAQEAGIPDGVFSVVTGDESATAEVLNSSSMIRAISLKGPVLEGGRAVGSPSRSVKKISLAFYGSAPFIVFSSANISTAVQDAIAAKFQSSGQASPVANRFYIQREVYDEFCRLFVCAAKDIVVGDGLKIGTDIGPLINKEAVGKCEQFVADAVDGGARLLFGGWACPSGSLFFNPTVLADVSESMLCRQEDAFSPIAMLMPFDSEEYVVRKVNTTPHSFAAYCHSGDVEQLLRVGESLECGVIGLRASEFTAPRMDALERGQVRVDYESCRLDMDEYFETKVLCLKAD